MKWIPLPFPKCPSCTKSWGETFHKDCPSNSLVEVEPFKVLSRCKSCNETWELMNSKFSCSCGHSFNSNDVKGAIENMLSLKRRLEDLLKEMNFDEQKIDKISNDSFSSWLNERSYEIGKSLGIIAGRVIGIIARIFK